MFRCWNKICLLLLSTPQRIISVRLYKGIFRKRFEQNIIICLSRKTTKYLIKSGIVIFEWKDNSNYTYSPFKSIFCIKLTDVSLSELGRLGPALRYLSLAKCELISDNGVRNLARHCYRLR